MKAGKAALPALILGVGVFLAGLPGNSISGVRNRANDAVIEGLAKLVSNRFLRICERTFFGHRCTRMDTDNSNIFNPCESVFIRG